MSNYVWLWDYCSYHIVNVYGIVIQTSEFDGVERFWLENKERLGGLNDVEKEKLENLQQQSYQFTKAWRERQSLLLICRLNFLKNLMLTIILITPKKEEAFFKIINGYLVINKKLYNVISQFNLGKTHFSQVYLYDIETEEQLLDEPYYFVNIAEKFSFLDIDNSKGLDVNFYQPSHPMRSIGEPKDDDIKFLLIANDFNIDLWHEARLRDSLFFSDGLVQALFKAGFTQKELGLVRCVVK